MPKLTDRPQNLKPFLFHGLELVWRGEGGQAVGDCPFCTKEGKFYVALDSGKWDCKTCGGKGNALSFLWRLHEVSLAAGGDYRGLASERKLLSPDTPPRWGACQSVLTGEWLVPAYSPSGKVCQLYRYVAMRDGDKVRKRLLPTPPDSDTLERTGKRLASDQSGQHGLLWADPVSKSIKTVYVCEGVWDGMTLWEVVRQHRGIADAAVIAVPSCNVWRSNWNSIFSGRKVVFLYDSDYPVGGGKRLPAGLQGTKKASGLLGTAEKPPSEIFYLDWGPDGYDPQRPNGYDVRDLLTGGKQATIEERRKALEGMLSRLSPVPSSWLEEVCKAGKSELASKPCTEWSELVKAWRLALTWTEGLDRALGCMLACITSTRCVGDQLWIKVIGPPAAGKSVLCEALSVARKYVYPVSTLRGFHSGYGAGGEGSEDISLLAKLKDKTLVTKDGDTLLQQPNLKQILSEARDIYDRASRTHYRNRTARAYEGLNMTWILCGTESLRVLDDSELGERSLDCVIVDDMPEDMEEEIGLRVAYRADMEVTLESNGRAAEQHEPARVEAMRLTGGYVEYLRENAQRLLARVQTPDWAIKRCQVLGRFTSFMRARPSIRQGEKAQRELSFRLIAQLVRMAKCLAVVLNRDTVDDEVMRRITAVALDTSRGRSLKLVQALVKVGDKGLSYKRCAELTNETYLREKQLLTFLMRIGVVESFQATTASVYVTRPPLWRLTPTIKRLYAEVRSPTPVVVK